MKNKNLQKILKIFVWINEKRNSLIIAVISIYIYSILHEYTHYITNFLLGYNGKIVWGLLRYQIILYDIDKIPFNHYLLIAILPYTLNLILVFLLHILNVIFPKYNKILAKLAFFPFIDTLWNFLMILPAHVFALPNDFLNLIKVGILDSKKMVIFIVILIVMFILATFYLFHHFYKIILNIIKIDKNDTS